MSRGDDCFRHICHDRGMNARVLERLSHTLLFLLLAASVLWRGGKGIEGTWLLVGAGCCIVLLSFARRNSHTKGERGAHLAVWGTLMAFFVWTLLSYFFSLTRNYGLDEVLRDGTFILLFLWSARTVRDEKGAFRPFFLRILRFLTLLTIVGASVGTAVYLFQPVNRFVGSFFYYRFSTDYWPNAWALYILLTWPVVLWWTRQAASVRMRILRELLLGWILGTFFLSYSRGAAIAFCGQLLLFLIFVVWRNGKKEGRARIKENVRTLLVVAAMAVITFTATNAMRARFYDVESVTRKVTFTAAEGTSSFTERREFFRQAVSLAVMRPLFGWGPYSFRFIQPRLQEHVLQTSDHPHNAFLKLAVERGWMAAALWLAVLGITLVSAVLKLLRGKEEKEREVLLILFVAGVGVLAHNLIDFNLQFVGIALPWYLFLGALASFPRINGHAGSWQRRAEIVLAILLLLVAVVEFRVLAISSLGRHAEAAGKKQEALEWYKRAEPHLFPRDMHLSRAILFVEQTAYVEAQQAVERYLALNGEDARAWKIQGDIQMKLFQADKALRSYQQAFLFSKYNDVGILRGYLDALARNGKQREAQGEMVRLLGAFADAIQRNTHFIALSGNVEQYHELARIAAMLYPDNAARIRELDVAVEQHAKEVRADFTARKPGYLW